MVSLPALASAAKSAKKTAATPTLVPNRPVAWGNTGVGGSLAQAQQRVSPRNAARALRFMPAIGFSPPKEARGLRTTQDGPRQEPDGVFDPCSSARDT